MTTETTRDDAARDDADRLYPPLPLQRDATAEAGISVSYASMIESQCGTTDDSQPVESYDGTLGVTRAFVDARQGTVGQLQWDDDLADHFDNPGNVSGVRWCTGTLVSHDLFLTAGHCFDSNPGGWVVPRRNGTNTPISPAEIAQHMHVNFDFQDDPSGNPRPEVEFRIAELVEDDPGGLDTAVVRLAGVPGARFGHGRLAASDPPVGDMLAIIGHPAGVPKRVEAGPLTSYDGHRIRYDDIDTLGGNSGSAIWHSPSGRVVGVHTNGGCTTNGGSNFGMRIEKVREVSATARRLDHLPLPLAEGVYTVRQQSNGRFVDAHEHAGEDFRLVTRPAQGNDTQRWRFTPVGVVVTMTQESSGRFVDAHEHAGEDFGLVTRTDQGNDTQRWVLMAVPGEVSTYTIQQLSNGRFVDAHVTSAADFEVVTRTAQGNDTQRWLLSPQPGGTFRIAQRSTGRFLDAHEVAGKDFAVVTRPLQQNSTQLWRLTEVAAVYTVQQVSSGRFVDAHEIAGQDFRLVTRPAQGNDTQRWVLSYLGGSAYTIQQLSNARFVDAHEHAGEDFRLVTREAQGNATQRWLID
ncbi:RICIN domain-containing protein [Thalassiella azotivora]